MAGPGAAELGRLVRPFVSNIEGNRLTIQGETSIEEARRAALKVALVRGESTHFNFKGRLSTVTLDDAQETLSPPNLNEYISGLE